MEQHKAMGEAAEFSRTEKKWHGLRASVKHREEKWDENKSINVKYRRDTMNVYWRKKNNQDIVEMKNNNNNNVIKKEKKCHQRKRILYKSKEDEMMYLMQR